MKSQIALLFLLHLTIFQTLALDQTIVEKASGVDVVDVTLGLIRSYNIFPDDFGYLKRAAYVSTNFGEDPAAFTKPNYGGIWHLYTDDFTRTLNQTYLAPKYAEITKRFGIDYPKMTFNDLLKPLHCALATQMFILVLDHDGVKLPQTLEKQSEYWFTNFRDKDSDTAATFIDLVTEWEDENKCDGKMDLLVVLDESGSIGKDNFKVALDFVAQLFASYSLDFVRQGFMTFSSNVYGGGIFHYRDHFKLDNKLTAAEIQRLVLATTYRQGGTETNVAIKHAVDLYAAASERPGVPKIMTLFTDGESTGNGGVSNSALAQKAGIFSFAVGIGDYKMTELIQIAYGDQTHVFGLTDFDALKEFFYRMNSETCQIPQLPNLNDTTTDTLKKNERRYYSFEVADDGLTVFLNTTAGKTGGFYSFSYKSPNAAFNDGVLNGETFIQPPGGVATLEGVSVYISVQGLDTSNDYTMKAAPGDLTTPEVTTEAGGVMYQPFVVLIALLSSIVVLRTL